MVHSVMHHALVAIPWGFKEYAALTLMAMSAAILLWAARYSPYVGD